MIGLKGYFKIETYNYRHYTMRKKIVDSQRATILSINILIFLQKIKIKLSLNFFKEIIKIFLISGTIYYFPIICIQIFLVFFKN